MYLRKFNVIVFSLLAIGIQGACGAALANDLSCRPEFKKYYNDNPQDITLAERDFKDASHAILKIKSHWGNSINAIVVVPYNIKRSQLRPTILTTLRELKQRYNNPHLAIIINFVPEDERLKNENIVAAYVQYKDDANPDGTSKLEIYYGIPSAEQIKGYNSVIGKPTCENALFSKKLMKYNNNYLPLSPVNKKDFDLGRRVEILGWNLYGKTDMKDLNQTISKRIHISVKEVSKLQYKMETYFSQEWGHEIYTFYASELTAP